MLCLHALEEFEHIAPALDPTVRCGRATGAQAEEGLKRRLRLLSTVVSEHELVEVGLELRPADAVMGTNQPVLEVANDSIGERYDGGRALAERRSQRVLKRGVPISSRLQAGERPQAVGVNRRAGGDGRLDDVLRVVAVKSGRTASLIRPERSSRCSTAISTGTARRSFSSGWTGEAVRPAARRQILPQASSVANWRRNSRKFFGKGGRDTRPRYRLPLKQADNQEGARVRSAGERRWQASKHPRNLST